MQPNYDSHISSQVNPEHWQMILDLIAKLKLTELSLEDLGELDVTRIQSLSDLLLTIKITGLTLYPYLLALKTRERGLEILATTLRGLPLSDLTLAAHNGLI